MDWNERLSKWADKLEAGVDKMVDFGSAEIPEYVKELILWEIVNHAILAGVFAALLLGVGLVWRCGWNRLAEAAKDDREAGRFLGTAIAVVLAGFFGFFLLDNARQATKAYVAPRVVIIEKVAELATGKKNQSR